ncbi:MAG: hypothetical protein PHH08_03435 [Candidatus ainarchaeum sp.]|nr:hypothetical protein [Candidatus ainarchaeum sp.]
MQKKIVVMKASFPQEIVYSGPEKRALNRRALLPGRRKLMPSKRGETTDRLFGRRTRGIRILGRLADARDIGRTLDREWIEELRRLAVNSKTRAVSGEFRKQNPERHGETIFVKATLDRETGDVFFHSTRRSNARRKSPGRRNAGEKILADA